MRRITNEEELNELVAQIKVVVTPDKVEDFLDKRFTAYNKVARVDAHLTMKEGKVYLPYPNNIRLIAKLHDANEGSKDEYDI